MKGAGSANRTPLALVMRHRALTINSRSDALAALDAMVTRCRGCDALVLPVAYRRRPHVCAAR